MKKIILLVLLCNYSFAQQVFTRKDSLRGGLRIERTCFDVKHYDLSLTVNPTEKTIVGQNEMTFRILSDTKKIQLDLFANMNVDSIIYQNKKLKFNREFDAFFIDFENNLKQNSTQKIKIFFSGKPQIAKNAPWDGGFVYKKSQSGQPWIAVACQGDGASLWFPCKDTQTDEPDNGVNIHVAVPNGLMNVSNGRLQGSEDLKNGYTRWDWEVKNPINNYDITLNIGDYVNFSENYKGLDLSFYVLRENLEKATIQFQQVKPMMDCFQSKFGEYPFKTDGYKLVETPYLGMEHQSCVAYGNRFANGYLGQDLSGTGVGLGFDYIIIHESGHEWFGNSITSQDVADMWIHEGFTCYTESVFLECTVGYENSQTYINGLRNNIQNDKAIIGQYGVSNEGSGDMYYKGALMLNTIRHILNNDDLWWKTLKKYSEAFKHQIINTKILIDFFNKETKMKLDSVFYQYLKYRNVPFLETKIVKNKVFFRWISDVLNFEMPVDVDLGGKSFKTIVTNSWTAATFKLKKGTDFKVNTIKYLFNFPVN